MGKFLVRNYFVFISILLFVFSLTQTAFITIDEDRRSALFLFLLGPLGLIVEFGACLHFLMNFIQGKVNSLNSPNFVSLTWLANPMIIFSWIFIQKNTKLIFILTLLSTVLIIIFGLYGKVLNNEAGHYTKIIRLSLGYWCWFLSCITMFLASIIYLNRKQNSHNLMQ